MLVKQKTWTWEEITKGKPVFSPAFSLRPVDAKGLVSPRCVSECVCRPWWGQSVRRGMCAGQQMARPRPLSGYMMTEAAEPEPGLHGQYLLDAILSVKTDRQQGLKGGRGSRSLWGPRAARGGGVGVGHVTHTYCIFCGSVPRHKALGKQKGCPQWEGGGKQHWPSSSPGKTQQRLGAWRPSSPPRAIQPPSPPSPCNFGCGSFRTDGTGPLEGRVTHKTEAAGTAPHLNINTEGTPAPGPCSPWHVGGQLLSLRQDSHTGQARLLPSQGFPEADHPVVPTPAFLKASVGLAERVQELGHGNSMRGQH